MSKNVPEVRFEGFSEEWRPINLSELMDFSNGINAPKESYGKGRKMISVMDILDESYLKYENIRSSVEVSTSIEEKNKVEYGDLIFVRSSEVSEEVGWSKAYLEKEYALYSGFSIRGKKKGSFSSKFVELSLNYTNRKQIERKAGGSTRFNISQTILNTIEILKASYEEQQKIGTFFKQLDDTIALQQQLVEQQQQYKKAMLQKMFPQKGERVPKVRFDGFSGDWEERKLGDLVTIKSGWSPSNFVECSTVEGNVFLKVDDLNASIRTQKSSKIHVLNNIKFPLIPKRSVVFPKRGAAIMTNKVRSLKVDSYMDTNMMGLIPQNIIDDFLYTFIEKTGLYKIADTSTIPQINNKHIEPYALLLPIKEEQQKIGTFFKQLDDTIALHQKKLEDYQQLKKALLQCMFV